ncbi:MAG: bifunctional (p)ppGpp synthetase/guanosine-3',5'-bis(diphosphate) 3'-pyrophosphohydrolase [Gammaproteobacteria bacterium]|nr:bifunctional (p)ppGpp synthetase/guanosine-3',5'-bis(diphosphate) 3'-pyrophosphohydrolase [Gammaproteobacteria bacterium]
MLLYKQLHEKLNYLEPDKIEQIYQAYLIALEYHSDQKRESGEKYIMHPIAVASILADMRIDYQSIIAALLHDVIEDTPATKEDIIAKFGQTIADLVDGVTKLTQIESAGKDETQAQNFRKMVLAMSRDIRVILIKLADRLHNMQTVSSLPPYKRHRMAKETLDIYAPIANRLGMYKVYIALEDLAFAALYPRRYKILEKAVEQVYGKNKETIELLDQELNEAFSHSVLKEVKIFGRTKHLYGIYKKMLNHSASFANIMDVYAFRIVVPNVDDSYRALGVIHNLYKPLPGKFKDYIAIPKFNGYQSLHTVLFGPYGAPVEVQIRSRAMDQMASNGIAAHWLYKTGDETLTAIHMRAQQWVNKLIEMQQHASSSSEFFENVKIDLFPDKVYVFTPKGDIMELMRGTTAVDFAYTVHTDVGNTCVAARINRRFLPLSTVLLNGQTVSIVTSHKSEPNPEWLSFVVTSKARSNIRQYLKNKKREELVALGKQLFDKAFTEVPFDSHKIHPEAMEAFLKKAGFKNQDALYEDIGLGNNMAILVAYQLINRSEGKEEVIANGSTKPLLISGAEGVAITFSSCCCPIPGDPIFGYLNAGYGLEVHTDDCVNLAKLRKQPEKCLPVSWAEDVTGDFRVALNVEVINQVGSLAELTQAISKTNALIDDISSGEHSGDYVLFSMHLLVKNLSHFERVKRYIGNVSSVVAVVRKKGN